MTAITRYMKHPGLILGIMALLTAAIAGCSKETDNYASEDLSAYLNLSTGKYIRYRLDSLEYIEFGQKDTTVYYEAKEVVEDSLTDNEGRTTWRIVRYLRDTASQSEDDWQINLTYYITPTRNSVEVVENNFRYIKLQLPISEGFTWKGNAYLETYSADPNWEYSWLDNWDYTYSSIQSPFVVFNNAVVDSTITINQQDITNGFPSDPDLYSSRDYSVEVYGKGIGMIYKELVHWEHQPPNGGVPSYTEGFGLKMVMIDHN